MAFEKTIDNDPPQEVWEKLSGNLWSEYQDDRAISTLERAIERNPTIPLLWETLSVAYETKGDNRGAAETWARGIETLRTAVEQNSSDLSLWCSIVKLYQARGDHRSAI